MADILLIKAANVKRHLPSVTFPLGLMYLASSLRAKGSHRIRIVDTRIAPGALDHLEGMNPDIIGISALTIEAESLYRIAGIMKRQYPGSILVAGGPHPTYYSMDVLSHHEIDYVVRGEGEETFHQLVTALDAGKEADNIRGLCFRRNGTIQSTGHPFPIKDLDALPFPAWDLVDVDRYTEYETEAPLGKRRYMNIFSSRACPYQCIFCHNMFGKSFNPRSPENVLKELDILYHEFKIDNFEFLDDIFNFDIQRAERIMDLISGSGMKASLSFPNGLRGDRLPERLLRKMKDAGTVQISIALETASPRLQALIRKKCNLDRIHEAIDCSSNLGILTTIFLMIGFPTETKEEAIQTIQFAARSKAHICQSAIVIPFSGTQLARDHKELIDKFTIHFGDYDYYSGNFNLSRMTDEDLFSLHNYTYRKFYLNPRRLLSIIRCHPDKMFIPTRIISILRKAFMSHTPR